MSSLLQNILVAAVVAGAIGYAVWLTYKSLRNRHRTTFDPSNPCAGCEGCSLKQEIREKSCPKGLFPPK